MSTIYVSGHRNPDTDSIASAIGYANLRQALGDREYQAVRIGPVNDETQRILDYFGCEAPELIHNMRTQVRDLDFDRPVCLSKSVTLDLAYHTLHDSGVSALPILNDDGTLYGMFSATDIAHYVMDSMHDSYLKDVPLFNLLSVLEGVIVNDSCIATSVTGNVLVVVPRSKSYALGFSPDTIVICGQQPDVIERAMECGVSCIIICDADIDRRFKDSQSLTCIISTPMNARQVAHAVYQAVPVRRLCSKEDTVVSFHLDDYLDDVREVMAESRYHAYPVLDENDKVVGTISRFHLLRPNRKKVVLVDHNEMAQSVPGLDQAEIVAIVDHHRLADIQTGMPVYVRNEPVGCTATILTAMYQEQGVVPPPQIAGLMAAAILSDTVLFRSPTCTKRDIAMANRLASIADVSLEELGREMFQSNSTAPVDELLYGDYKDFHIADRIIGVSQITCSDSTALRDRSEEFLALLRTKKEKEKYDLVILMLTDILQDGTHLYYAGSDDTITRAFNVPAKDGYVFLHNVMSRKKQVIPSLTALWG